MLPEENQPEEILLLQKIRLQTGLRSSGLRRSCSGLRTGLRSCLRSEMHQDLPSENQIRLPEEDPFLQTGLRSGLRSSGLRTRLLSFE